MQIIPVLLYPFSTLYSIAMHCRNILFDIGIKKEKAFELPIISIGNITVGGTGKTPMAECIIKHLHHTHNIALLSRGYKRKTRGFVKATPLSSYMDIGDEPKQIKTKFTNITVAVCEKRVEGVSKLLQDNRQLDAIILDDAYQHRHIKPSYSILLIDYNRPIWNDFVFPSGRLRESAQAKRRAHTIIITKCPEQLSEKEKNNILTKLKPLPDQNVYFSAIQYGQAINNQEKIDTIKTCVALSGIAKPEPFISFIQNKCIDIEKKLIYPDHYNFSDKDIATISDILLSKRIITTEKDYMRLAERINQTLLRNLFYIPIETKFLFNGENHFFDTLKNHIKNF